MYCDVCRHNDEINAALRPCQSCEHSHGDGNQTHAAACAKCPHLKPIQAALRPCYACEAGRLHGQISMDAIEAAGHDPKRTPPSDHFPSDGVTNLPPDVEDALRKALFAIFDFTPLELLLIQHVIHGRNVGTFREPLAELKKRLNTRYDLSRGSQSFRAVARQWKTAIVRKMPQIADLFDSVTDANAGHSR